MISPFPRNCPCPWLPDTLETHDFMLTRRHGPVKGPDFYRDALRYAQSQWIAGKPAQAILQLNRAWMADLSAADPVLLENPPPYRALIWILEKSAAGQCGYLGNPVRHFQHLATRVSGPRAEIRSARAWLCFHLAEKLLDRTAFPRDGRQLAREGFWIPSLRHVLNAIAAKGWVNETLYREG